MIYWCEFIYGGKATIVADSLENLHDVAKKNGKIVKYYWELPYVALPILGHCEEPAFCFQPEICKGRSSCPKRMSCSE